MTHKLSPRILQISQWLLLLLPILVFVGKAPVDIAASLIGALFLANSALTKDWSWLKNTWIKCALAFWVYLIIRSIFTEFPNEALGRSASFIRYPAFAAALAYFVINDSKFMKKLWIAITIGILLLSADALLQFLTGTDILDKESLSGNRLTGPFRRPRIGYTIAWMLFPMLGGLLIYSKSKTHIFLAIAATFFSINAVILSGERSPTLLTFLGLCILICLIPNIRKQLIWLAPLIILGIGSFLFSNQTTYDRQVLSTIDTITNLKETPYGRIFMDASDTIKRAPIFGIGPKHYRTECKKPELNYREFQQHPHNFYLEIWSETGIIGLVLVSCIFVCWFKLFWKTRKQWKHDYLFIALVVGIAIRLWPIIANPSFYASWNIIPFWLMAGWALSILHRNDLQH